MLASEQIVALMVGFVPSLRAQSADPVSPPPSLDVQDTTERAAELQRWMEAFTEWLEWSAEWTNRREPGWFTASRDRRQKPAPPECADRRE